MSKMSDTYAAALADAFTQAGWDAQRAMSLELLSQLVNGTGGAASGLKLQPYLGASSVGLVASLPIGATATIFGGFVCFNSNATDDRYLQFFDAAAVPVNGTAPVFSWPVFHGGGSSSFASFSFGDAGLKLTNGLILVSSSTPATKTISGADLLIMALYRTT